MTITYHGGNIIRGTAADRTGGTWTNLQTGYLFIESDTQLIYYWNGTAWTRTSSKSLLTFWFGISSATQGIFYTPGGYPGLLLGTESQAGLIMDYNFTVKRIRANVSTNGKTGSVVLRLRDDSADITGALVTITAGTITPFDSGAISVDVAAGSMVNWKFDGTGSGTGTIQLVAVAECEATLG